MTRVLRGDEEPDGLEPTPGVGPCLEDLFPAIKQDSQELFAEIVNSEHNYVDALVYKDEKTQIYIRSFVSLRCLEVLYLVAELCGKDVTLEPFQWPEVDKAIIRGECLLLMARPDPPLKALNLLHRLQVPEPTSILGYRPVPREEVEAVEQ